MSALHYNTVNETHHQESVAKIYNYGGDVTQDADVQESRFEKARL